MGTVCLLFLVAGLVFHIKPLIVRSGSMEPTIATGALALSHTVPASDLAVGQIVSVKTLNGTRVTHRIVEIQPDGSRAMLTLKGDANGSVDQQVYDVGQAERVVFDVPYAGYVVAWTSGRTGVFLGGLLAGGLVLLALRSPSRRPGAGSGSGKSNALGAGVALVLVGTVLHGTTPAQDTGAYFNDDAGYTGVTAASYTVPAPPNTNCSVPLGGSSSSREVDLTWPANPSPLLSYDTTVSTITATTAVTDVSTNKELQVIYDPSTQGFPTNTIVTVTTRAHPVNVASWLSPPTTWKFMTAKNSSFPPTCQELVAPTLVVTAPTAVTELVATKRNTTQTLCGNKYIVCGTAIDDSSVSEVSFILQKGSQCWNGTTSSYGTDCATWQPTTNSSPWTNTNGSNNLVDNAYPGTGTYTLTVRATDGWGNVGTLVQTFTLI
nr:signal peptidase I [Nocardioides ginsengisegetis]